jgi:putative endonuclease
MSDNQGIGRTGENIATEFLIKNGYEILERNWSSERTEIDIIAQKEEVVIFVEVKTRTGDFYGLPEDAVDEAKEENILDAAEAYLEIKDLDNEIRFDIISIILKSGKHEVYHIIDAF